MKSSEKMTSLVAKGQCGDLVKSEFEKVLSLSKHEAHKKCKYLLKTRQYLRQLSNRRLHLIKNSPFPHNIFPDRSILATNELFVLINTCQTRV